MDIYILYGGLRRRKGIICSNICVGTYLRKHTHLQYNYVVYRFSRTVARIVQGWEGVLTHLVEVSRFLGGLAGRISARRYRPLFGKALMAAGRGERGRIAISRLLT